MDLFVVPTIGLNSSDDRCLDVLVNGLLRARHALGSELPGGYRRDKVVDAHHGSISRNVTGPVPGRRQQVSRDRSASVRAKVSQ